MFKDLTIDQKIKSLNERATKLFCDPNSETCGCVSINSYSAGKKTVYQVFVIGSNSSDISDIFNYVAEAETVSSALDDFHWNLIAEELERLQQEKNERLKSVV